MGGGCNYVIGRGSVKGEAEAAGTVKLPLDVASSHARNLISLSPRRRHGDREAREQRPGKVGGLDGEARRGKARQGAGRRTR